MDFEAAAPQSKIERQVAALDDPEQMLQLLHTEATLRRAQRLSGNSESRRQIVRMLCVFGALGILVAAVVALWYLQGTLQERRAAVVPSPAGAAP